MHCEKLTVWYGLWYGGIVEPYLLWNENGIAVRSYVSQISMARTWELQYLRDVVPPRWRCVSYSWCYSCYTQGKVCFSTKICELAAKIMWFYTPRLFSSELCESTSLYQQFIVLGSLRREYSLSYWWNTEGVITRIVQNLGRSDRGSSLWWTFEQYLILNITA